jgi:hypothetical protein
MNTMRTNLTASEHRELAAIDALRATLSAQFGARVTVSRADRFRGDPAWVAAVGGRPGPLSYDGPMGALRALGAGHGLVEVSS